MYLLCENFITHACMFLFQVGSLAALITAAVALAITDTVVPPPTTLGNTTASTITASSVEALAGCVVGVAGLAILWQVLVIVLRFCNIGLINICTTIFLSLVSVSKFQGLLKVLV